jgi:hypothetical protein
VSGKKKQLLYVAIWLFLIAFILVLLNGCAASPTTPHQPPVNHPVSHPIDAATQELAAISSLMGYVATLSVVCVGLGVAMMVYIHTPLGPAFALGGVSTLVLSIVIKSTIWFVPWIAGGVAALALIAVIIDAVQKRSLLAAFRDAGNLLRPGTTIPA